MKKQTLPRRLLSLTLAASVVLPQPSVFATSLWTEYAEERLNKTVQSASVEGQADQLGELFDGMDRRQPSVELSPSASEERTQTPVADASLSEDEPEKVGDPEEERQDSSLPTRTDGTALPPDVIPGEDEGKNIPGTSDLTTDDDNHGQGAEQEKRDEDKNSQQSPSEAEAVVPEVVLPQEIPELTDDVDKEEKTSLLMSADALSATMMALNEEKTFWPMSIYRIGYGVQFEANDGKARLTAINGLPINGLFAVETRDSAPYGYRLYDDPDKGNVPYVVDGDDSFPSSFVVFPSADTLGRVPDQQFVGWYVYRDGDKSSAKPGYEPPQCWYYGDEDKNHAAGYSMDKVNTKTYGETDPGYDQPYDAVNTEYDTLGALGDEWDGGYNYGYGYYFDYDDDGNVQRDEDGELKHGDADNPVSIVGRWKPSDKSGARDGKTSLTTTVVEKDGTTEKEKTLTWALYSEDLSTKPLSECEETTFSAAQTEYWLRVPADVTSLDLTFHTEELYYADYTRDEGSYDYDYDAYQLSAEKSHVQVSATFGGETTYYVTADRVAGGDTVAKMAPKWDREYGEILPQNTPDDPAHSEWTVKGIALTPSAGAGKLYTDIKIVVTSPSGEKTTTYTFHVQRLTEPTLTQNWGNTPMGMIERDVSSEWGSTQAGIAEKKQEAKDYLVANRKFDEDLYPRGSANQLGTVYRNVYGQGAWLGEDVDLDPTAIVVYQDSAFLDPGISLTDSEGLPVDIKMTESVERSLRLESVETLSIASIGKAGIEGWYTANGLVESESQVYEVLSTDDGSDLIDLRELNVLPGIYTLEYRFKDKVADKSYGVDSDDYVTESGKTGAAAFSRTVVVLPTPGDVDMDGAVTMADALALEGLLKENETTHKLTLNEAPIDTNQMAALFAYRVCDINGDGKLDHNDISALRRLPNPKTKNEYNASNSDYFYIPLPTGETGERYTRPVLTEATTGVAKLKLEYLGKEGGIPQKDGYFAEDADHGVKITGPWEAIPVEEQPDGSIANAVTLEDVFWLGVSLENAAELDLPNVKAMTFTILYDAYYLEPAVVLDADTWNNLGDGYDTTTEAGKAQQFLNRWTGMMRRYNLAGENPTVWNEDYKFTEIAGPGGSFTAHYSTAVGPLERAIGQSDLKTRLKELTFSVELKDLENGAGLSLQDTGKEWLFAVPFRLRNHPFNQKTAQLVEFKAGMQGFTLVCGDTTAAYSSQDEIFGGGTVNLKGKLDYGNLGATIPLGKDKTEIYWIVNGSGVNDPNAKYDVAFRSNGGWTRPEEGKGTYQQFPTGGELIGTLPPGLTYHQNIGYIEGIPTQAGQFDFSIGSVPYRIVVDKATLHFWAVNQSSYYGQSQFRNETSDDFTYEFDVRDLRSLERERAEENGIKLDPKKDWRGKGADLATILSDPLFNDPVNQPYFKAVTDDGTAVTNATGVGTYRIQCRTAPLSTNYEFVYTPDNAGGRKGLSILQRPIQVVGINGDVNAPTVVGWVFSDRPGALSHLKAQLNGNDPAVSTFQVRLGTTVTDKPGEYEGLPLTTDVNFIDGVVLPGDSLIVTYSAQYIRTEIDLQAEGTGFFILEEGENEGLRDVSVSSFELTGGKGSENYRLVSKEAVESVRSGRVQGKVLRRNIKSIEITQLPPMEYPYGNQLTSAAALHYYIVKDGNQEEGQYAYSAESVQSLGITVTWVTAEERDAYLNGKTYDKNDALPYRQSQRFTTEYDGRYICLTVSTADDNGNPIVIRRFSDIPLVVRKRVLTLTAVSASRFYGEENAGLTFTYDPAQLANVDRRAGLTGAGEELAEILSDENWEERGWTQNYVAPTLRAVFLAKDPAELTEADELKQSSPYTGMNNAVMIYGAKSNNYDFEYVFTNTEGKTTIQSGYGAGTYRIEKRLIVVEAVTKSDAPLSRIYADTRRILTDNLPLTMSEVELGLPVHTDTTTTYFANGGNSGRANMGYADGATAVVAGDEISFTYTATVIPTDGTDYVKYSDFSKGYFNMDTEDANQNLSRGYKEYPVQVSNLRLTGKSANNYALVYKSAHCGQQGLPNEYQQVSNCVNPEVNATKTYYAAKVNGTTAMAQVWLRPITDIEILSTGKLKYTYGETYTPNQWDQDSRDPRGMVVRIHYENDPTINNYEGNRAEEEVSYLIHHYLSDGTAVTTYDNRGLSIHYLPEDVYKEYQQTGKIAGSASSKSYEMRLQTPLYVIHEHNGAHLVVVGKRAGQSEPIISRPTEETLRVEPKTLTVRADDKYRSYGEENGAFTFSFDASQLALGDRSTLGVSAGMQDGALLEKLAQDTFMAYTAPTFKTEANKKSNVLNGGQNGYPITVATTGTLDNYALQYETGTLYIYPRRVKLSSFDKEAPIYTIFSDDDARIVFTNVANDRFALVHSTEGGYVLGGRTLYTTGDALVEGDTMVLRIKVKYPDNLDLKSDEAKGNIKVVVEDASIIADSMGVSGNYQLETLGSSSGERAAIVDGEAIGTVELRNITTISIAHAPDQLTYTYGQALDLRGLSIKIDYNTGGGSDTNQHTTVDYMGPEQFAQYGLHVYYYDSATWDKNDDPDAIGKENGIKLREAATGDHLTIAPTHDTQIMYGADKLFAANGKYLLITAQRHEDQATVTMIVDTPIRVNPLPIEFTLSAADKIYDGTTQAAGTITFTNIFNRSGLVDDYHPNGITDLVYPVMGADYETPWTTPMGQKREGAFKNFKEYVAQNGYSFTTGSYVPNDPDKPTENQKLNWTAGYTYGKAGTMTFAYLDPNVAYASEPQHDYYGALAQKQLQVTGLRLAGPDAENYTLIGRTASQTASQPVGVTASNVTSALGYKGSGLPTATIHKANRANLTTELLPQVEIDPHTNVVRINYDQSLSAITGGEVAAYLDELHFEFALQQVVAAEDEGTAGEEPDEDVPPTLTITDIIQWAGLDGTSTWADPRYFGGEAAPMTSLEVRSSDPEAPDYVPKEDDIPKADSITENTTIKGQVYQWISEDDGFVLAPEAYPGGVIWPGYDLYTTDRTALARDAVFLPVVRAAETHNYNPSLALSSVEGYTPEMIQALLDAQEARKAAANQWELEQAQQALNAAIQTAGEAISAAVLDARTDAQAEVDALMGAGEKGGKLEERPVRSAAPAIKTYKQSIETVSVKELQGEGAPSGAEPYLVPTLEAIWFTDVQELPTKEVLDAVVWNTNPVRYRTYAWDNGLNVPLVFDEKEDPISLYTPFEVELPGETGGEGTGEMLRVNEDHNLRLYADITFPSSGQNKKVEKIILRPGTIMVTVNSPSMELEIAFYPEQTRKPAVLWVSSNPEVVTVDGRGRLTFVGIGTAYIIATVPSNIPGAPPMCSTYVEVTVVGDWKTEYPASIFDFGHLDAFLLPGEDGEGEKLFLPEARMTRGEAAMLLAQFYVENPTWSKTGPQEFTDLTGEEEYAEAARLLSDLGVMVGYPDGTFGGEQYISRAEFIALLVRMMGLEAPDTTGQAHAFLDTGEEDTWAYSEIDAMSTQPGVLAGVGGGYFAPNRSIVRSEAAAFLTRLLRFPLNQTGELIIPVDVTEDHWARDPILRAINGSQILEESFTTDA